MLDVRDPKTWPERPNLGYSRISWMHPTSHALLLKANMMPSVICDGSIYIASLVGVDELMGARLCLRCVRVLRSWGYLAREV